MSFASLPQQRRLSDIEKADVQDFLAVKPNKKVLQTHIIEKTGKFVRINDLHNLQTKKCKTVDGSLVKLLSDLQNEQGICLICNELYIA